jgi:hypothetical protein
LSENSENADHFLNEQNCVGQQLTKKKILDILNWKMYKLEKRERRREKIAQTARRAKEATRDRKQEQEQVLERYADMMSAFRKAGVPVRVGAYRCSDDNEDECTTLAEWRERVAKSVVSARVKEGARGRRHDQLLIRAGGSARIELLCIDSAQCEALMGVKQHVQRGKYETQIRIRWTLNDEQRPTDFDVAPMASAKKAQRFLNRVAAADLAAKQRTIEAQRRCARTRQGKRRVSAQTY